MRKQSSLLSGVVSSLITTWPLWQGNHGFASLVFSTSTQNALAFSPATTVCPFIKALTVSWRISGSASYSI